MLDRFIHVNSKGEELDFVKFGIYIMYNDLRDYSWSAITNDKKRIVKFKKEVAEKKLPLVFAINQNNVDEIKNAFYEHFDYDVINAKPGYFMINDYKYYCYVTSSEKSEYLIKNGHIQINLGITSDKPFWIKETTYTVDFNSLRNQNGGLKYTFKYPFTYKANTITVENSNFVESDGIIRFYGACNNPLIKVGNNVYQVNALLTEYEFLEIDTESKTIYKYDNFGNKINLFNYRNKTYDVFKMIPCGAQNITSNGSFKVDIVVNEKRSEPRWNSYTQTQGMKNSVTYQMLQ